MGNLVLKCCSLFTYHLSAYLMFMNPPNQFLEELLGIPATFNVKRTVIRSLIVALLLFLAESLPDLHLPSHILPTSDGKINRKQTMEAMVFGYVRSPDVHQAIIF